MHIIVQIVSILPIFWLNNKTIRLNTKAKSCIRQQGDIYRACKRMHNILAPILSPIIFFNNIYQFNGIAYLVNLSRNGKKLEKKHETVWRQFCYLHLLQRKQANVTQVCSCDGQVNKIKVCNQSQQIVLIMGANHGEDGT